MKSSLSSSAGPTVAKYADYASRDMALRPDAGRYECGTLNTIGCYGLRASIEFLLEVGIENIGRGGSGFGRPGFGDGAEQNSALKRLGPRSPETGAGIVSVRKPGHRSHADRPAAEG